MDHEHCMLLALPCGRDHMDVLQQSNNLQSGFITYLQQKQAAGIVNIAGPGSQQVSSTNLRFVFLHLYAKVNKQQLLHFLICHLKNKMIMTKPWLEQRAPVLKFLLDVCVATLIQPKLYS